MERMTIDEIARAVGCPGSYPGAVDVISTDSRSLPEGCLFVALEGERFDGHDFIPAALRLGAAAAVAHERRDYGPGTVLYVKNTQRALMEIAKAYRAKFSIRCVGVTGSVGKTTTKEMIADVLSCAYRTLKTEGNLNNEIGLPKTLFRLDRTTEAAVVEMGMQGLGEIAALAGVARPDVGVITNIGVSHLERLGSRENILKAKLELADALPDGAPLLLCGDNDLLSRVRIPRLDVRFYGIENPACGLRAKDLREGEGVTSFLLCGEFGELPVTIPCAGRHNVLNALAAFSAGLALDIPPEKCAAALREYMPSGMRQKVVHWRGDHGGGGLLQRLPRLDAGRARDAGGPSLHGQADRGARRDARAGRDLGAGAPGNRARSPPKRGSTCCLHTAAMRAIIDRARRRGASPSSSSAIRRSCSRACGRRSARATPYGSREAAACAWRRSSKDCIREKL